MTNLNVAGKFMARAVYHKIGAKPNTGEPYLEIICEIDGGVLNGQQAPWFGSLSPDFGSKGIPKDEMTIDRVLRVFPAWNGDLDALYENNRLFSGQPCFIETEIRDNGKCVVKWLNEPRGGGIDATGFNSLKSRLGNKARELADQRNADMGIDPGASPTPPSAPRPASEPEASKKDDLPF